jgi:REP element-mobilizing transposase RayT
MAACHTHYHNNLIHLVFSTKNRENLIRREMEEPLRKYFVGIGHNEGFKILACGGIENHCHLLYVLPATITLSHTVQSLKANSSRWIREQAGRFQWQKGYGAFSVSESAKPKVLEYIANQREHHARHSFEDEFIALLKKHNVDYDPRYVFD